MKPSTLLSIALMLISPLLLAKQPPVIDVSFGKPTFEQRLLYKKMYDKKPFPDATIYYYDNGVYKIISPGEEHYGVYVVEGSMTEPRFSVHYISLPSSDWGGTTAHHYLAFDREAGTFTQQATWAGDKNIPPQYGRFAQEKNTEADPLRIKWATHARPLPASP
jgi:hypothetical protein